MSVNRAKYSAPESVLSEKWTRVASVAQQDFPPPIELNSVTWEFIAVDLPVEGNDAHAEVRLHRVDDASRDGRKPDSPSAKEKLRARLSAVMLVLPTTPPPAPIPGTPTVAPSAPRLRTAVLVLLGLLVLASLLLVVLLLSR
jgi:hypothetical protein